MLSASHELPRLLLADDHAMLRDGLRAILKDEGFEVVAEASDGREAVKLAQSLGADVAILDISMPLLNGIDAAREILKSSPKTKIIILTMYTDDRYVLASLRAGIAGFVLKSKAASSLVQAIQAVCKGEVYLSSGVSKAVVDAYLAKDDTPADPLSVREREVLQLIAEGQNTKEIGSVLGISAKTAESHRTNIMQKLHIHEVAGLVRYAVREGLVQDAPHA
jgi:two-component system, NarL family, response regulator NreC